MKKKNIHSARPNYRYVKLASEDVEWLLANCQYTNTLDEMVSEYIISVEKRVVR